MTRHKLKQNSFEFRILILMDKDIVEMHLVKFQVQRTTNQLKK